MAIWDDVLTPRDRKVLENRNKRDKRVRERGFGTRPAVVIVDDMVNFLGDDPNEDIVETVKRFPKASGKEGWDAIRCTQELIKAARRHGVPVIYTTAGLEEISTGARHGDNLPLEEGFRIVDQVKPAPEDIVIYKSAPSGFFGTSLVQHLNRLDIDTVLVCGCTTSGCVRATVVDAMSYHYKVGLIEDCTFDRFQISHKVNLFDMNVKYADVLPVEKVKEYFQSLKGAKKVAVGVGK